MGPTAVVIRILLADGWHSDTAHEIADHYRSLMEATLVNDTGDATEVTAHVHEDRHDPLAGEAIDFLAERAADHLFERRGYEGSRPHVVGAIAGGISAHYEDPDLEAAESEYFEVDGESGRDAYERVTRATEEAEREQRERRIAELHRETFRTDAPEEYVGCYGTWDLTDGDTVIGTVVHNDPAERYFTVRIDKSQFGGAGVVPERDHCTVEYDMVDFTEEMSR